MTQAPNAYSPFPGEPIGEQKTSIMAVIALVCSLICLIPGLSIVGLVLGIIALLMIANSNGRLGGRGLAIAAIIVGLIVSAIWLTAGVVTMQMGKAMKGEFFGPLSKAMSDIEARDYATARLSLTPAAAAAITDADFDRFRDGYNAEMGAFNGGPEGLMEMFSMYGQLGQQMQQFQGGGSVIPFPGKFDNGLAVAAFQVDQAGGAPGSAVKIPLTNIMIVMPSGAKVTLYDPAGNASAPGTMPVPPAAPDAPTSPDTPEPGTTDPATPPGGG